MEVRSYYLAPLTSFCGTTIPEHFHDHAVVACMEFTRFPAFPRKQVEFMTPVCVKNRRFEALHDLAPHQSCEYFPTSCEEAGTYDHTIIVCENLSEFGKHSRVCTQDVGRETPQLLNDLLQWQEGTNQHYAKQAQRLYHLQDELVAA
jgi:hypothetical protein